MLSLELHSYFAPTVAGICEESLNKRVKFLLRAQVCSPPGVSLAFLQKGHGATVASHRLY